MELGTKTLIQEHFRSLPKDLQSYITSEKFAQTIEQIGSTHALTKQETAILEDEAVLVLMGLEPIEDYADNLEEILQKSSQDAESVAISVANEIFSPIKDVLGAYLEQASFDDTLDSEIRSAVISPSSIEQNRFEKRLEALPEELRILITSGKVKEQVAAIGTQFELTPQQTEKLEEQVVLRILGFLRKANFTHSLKENVGIDEQNVQEIENALDQHIFLEMRQGLAGATSNALPQGGSASASPVPAPPKTRHYGTDPYHEPIE